MAKTTVEILARIETLTAQLDKANLLLKQSQYVDLIDSGSRVDLSITRGDEVTSYTNVLVLGKRAAEGTSGNWFKVRVNEGTIDEDTISVRLSNITKLYGYEGEVVTEEVEDTLEEVLGDAPDAEVPAEEQV